MIRYEIKRVSRAEISKRSMKEYDGDAVNAFVAEGMNYNAESLGVYEDWDSALTELKKYNCSVKAMTSYGVLVPIEECSAPKYFEADFVYIEEQENDEENVWSSTGNYEFAEME